MSGSSPAIAVEAWPTEAELCAALTPRIRGYGRRHLGGHSAAEDLVQDVLTLIIQAVRAGKIAAPAALPAYALSVSRNLVRDRIRTSNRRLSLAGQVEAVSLEGRLPDWSVEAADVIRVGRCIERLPEREREVVIRSFLQDEPAEEIAASLGIAAGNLRVIRHRAIARLRALMEGEPCLEPEVRS